MDSLHAPVPRLGGFDLGLSRRGGLVPLGAASLLLDKPLRAIRALIENGDLRWAFDIRRNHASRSEPRVLRQSLLECAGLVEQPCRDLRTLSEDEDFRDSIDAALPKGFLLNPKSVSAGREVVEEAPAIRSQTFQDLQRALFPQEPVLRATDVAQFLACSGEHVSHLIADGLLKASTFRRKPHTTPYIFRASVLEFLKQRRML